MIMHSAFVFFLSSLLHWLLHRALHCVGRGVAPTQELPEGHQEAGKGAEGHGEKVPEERRGIESEIQRPVQVPQEELPEKES